MQEKYCMSDSVERRDLLLSFFSVHLYICTAKISLPKVVPSLQFIERLLHRVRMGPGKPGKSWNFTLAFSSPGKVLLVPESSGNLLNSNGKYEMYGRE